ncbi:MAG: alpha/beta hydrolase [Pseudomonadota bacterium]
MQTRWFEVKGNRFFARTWGDPALPPLLMLHGFPEYSGAWEDLAIALCDRFYCVAPDQRGYGESYCPPQVEAYRTGVLAADMAGVIEELGAPCAVLGHDWGAATAYGLAMFFPDMVSRLIILNGVHPVPFQRAMASGGAQSIASQYILRLRAEGTETWLAQGDYAKLLQLFSANMDLRWLTGGKLAAYKAEWSKPGRMTGMLNWYRASPLRVAAPGAPITDLPEFDPARLQVRCPHLLVWGTGDTALLPESRAGLDEFAADLTVVEIVGADHWLHHQVPQNVAKAILSWQ